MKVLWLTTSSMCLEPNIASLDYYLAEKGQGDAFYSVRFDNGKEEAKCKNGEVDKNIINAAQSHTPDIIMYTGPAEGGCRPKLETFFQLKKIAKTILICCDGGCPNWHPLLKTYGLEGCFDLMVNVDGNTKWPKRAQDLTLWGPIDPRPYSGKSIVRTTKVAFAGGMGARNRRETVSILKERCALKTPQREESWGSYGGYADFLLSCRAIINFPRTGSEKAWHLKYRVIEGGLAHCCLFEQKNWVTEKYLIPGQDYVEYYSVDDLCDKINGMTMGDLFGYGQSLNATINEKYNAKIFWTEVFNRLP